MDFYMAPTGNSSRSSLSSYHDSVSPTVSKASQFRQQNKQDRQQHSVTFQVYHEQDPEAAGSDDHISAGSMERELKASIAKLYQNYDFVTDEYDRLFDIVDSVREDYNNTKSLFLYHRYHEFKRLIKNAIRKWRSVEKRNSMAVSRKQSNASFAMAITGSLSKGLTSGLPGIPEESANSYSGNLNVRLRANKDKATKDLYDECTRLEREVFQYKSRNQQIKNLLCKLAVDYDSAKEHALHIWGRYKELKQMIIDVINADV